MTIRYSRIVTLSNIEVFNLDPSRLPAVTARPTYILSAIAIFTGEPTCIQVLPSMDLYPVKVLALLTILTQYGASI